MEVVATVVGRLLRSSALSCEGSEVCGSFQLFTAYDYLPESHGIVPSLWLEDRISSAADHHWN